MRKYISLFNFIAQETGAYIPLRSWKSQIFHQLKNALRPTDWFFLGMAGILALFALSEIVYVMATLIVAPVYSAAGSLMPGNDLLNNVVNGLGALIAALGKLVMNFFFWLVGVGFLAVAFVLWGLGIFKKMITVQNHSKKKLTLFAWLFLIFALGIQVTNFVYMMDKHTDSHLIYSVYLTGKSFLI